MRRKTRHCVAGVSSPVDSPATVWPAKNSTSTSLRTDPPPFQLAGQRTTGKATLRALGDTAWWQLL
ncbi:hypothetical protein KFK09_004381 [Dendrobium nobile]|uniref:Uncharacterized protein n=1 Tax=Dendrobium nobile TaxID=94219 RepID=A0A8T3C5W8_DENNO|nr:hypothetical protein KFK09_004381 [Dendrobium nobile]